MLFPSGVFLILFLPLVLSIYWLLPFRFKNLFLFLASAFFYAWGEPVYIYTLLFLTALNFGITRLMYVASAPKKWLLAAIILNLGVLFFLKYLSFFIDLVQVFIPVQFQLDGKLTVSLPLGVSFYAFHAISYAVDCAKKEIEPLNSPVDYGLYLFLFPHQIAGPIVRFKHIAKEIKHRVWNNTLFINGFIRFSIGLSKKVLLANNVHLVIEAIQNLESAGSYSSSLVWIELLAYFFYIYFDFSGYSDMAIGLGQLFGFHFPENFNKPYTSKSITEFWQRWHITLGEFMRNYVYIPLGGNRSSKSRTYFNLIIVFFLSGLWHGASFNFIIWGLFHGFWIVLDRLFLKAILDKLGIASVLFTSFIVFHGWLFFYAKDLHLALEKLSMMWSFHSGEIPVLRDHYFLMGILIICSIYWLFEVLIQSDLFDFLMKNRFLNLKVHFILSLLLFGVSYAYILAGSYSPFIYFNF